MQSGRVEATLGWLALGAVLTFVLYLPIWLALGSWLYPATHPDYWTFATPDHIIPIAAVLASILVLLTRWFVSRADRA